MSPCVGATKERVKPEAAGLIKSAMTVADIVDLIEARETPPKQRGPYKPRQPKAVPLAGLRPI
jgi:hypothetical protein